MNKDPPPLTPSQPGAHGTYGQSDQVQSARRDRHRRDQHFAARLDPDDGSPDGYGPGGFAGGGQGQSGYGVDFGQLDGARRHEKHPSERDYRAAGTGSKPAR
jgi:hypothetical protein